MEVTPETQAEARKRLVQSARYAKWHGYSGLEWIESEEVLSYCEEQSIDKSILEHIYQWTWKNDRSP